MGLANGGPVSGRIKRAGQLGSAASVVVALIGLLAPYLLPPPKTEPTLTVNEFANVISGNSGP